jgi:guanylate kinase
MIKQKSNSKKKKPNKTGVLIVITGASGAGKDDVMNGFMESLHIQKLGFQKIVTSTDRSPRPGEANGREYHFVTNETLIEMSQKGELVEPITLTGTSNKATSRKEIERIFNGENLVWRIDPSRAAEVALGEFFQRLFPENAKKLQKHTIVLFVTAPKEDIELRRKERDADKYDPGEYKMRDDQEKPHLEILSKYALRVENTQGQLDKTIKLAIQSTTMFYEKIKK